MSTAYLKRILLLTIGWTLPTIIFLFLFIVIASAVASPKLPMEYGVTFSHKYARELNLDWKKTYIEILDDLKVKNIRLISYWDEIEKERGVYDFTDMDYMLDEAEKRNVNVIMAVGRKMPRWPECFEPKWAKDEGEDFVRTRLLMLIPREVEHYKKYQSIKMWQVENEPFFPFGNCRPFEDQSNVEQEVNIVRSIDNRPITVSDSGEGGAWIFAYTISDYLSISMYRKVWLSFWGYFDWPFPAWSYRVKAAFLNIPLEKMLNTELQAEPWANRPLIEMSDKELSRTMDHKQFVETIKYAGKTGIQKTYFWGVEWWYYKKLAGDPFYWETSKKLFN